MIRFLFRVLGFLLLAAAFAAIVVDGTRSIAGGHVMLFSLSDMASWLGGGRFAALAADLAQAPGPARMLAAGVLALPAWSVTGTLGLILLYLGRPPAVGVGFSRRRA